MLKIIGVCLILCGAGGFGVAKAMQFYRQLRQLRDCVSALEILKCELNYTLMPLPRICRSRALLSRSLRNRLMLRKIWRGVRSGRR